MVKCSACGKFISATGGASCTTCTSVYHRACVSIPEKIIVPKDWVCPDCKSKLRKGDNSCTPVKNVCGAGVLAPEVTVPAPVVKAPASVVSAPAPVVSAPAPVVSAPAPQAESEVSAMRRELASALSEFRQYMEEFRSTITKMEERFDSFEHRLEAVERKQEEAPPVASEVVELRQTVEGLKAELNARDQEALLSDLDIGHLPEEKGVGPIHSVMVMAAKLGVTLAASDIVFAERVGPPPAAGGRPRRVIVRLVRRELRDELLRAARVRPKIATTAVAAADGDAADGGAADGGAADGGSADREADDGGAAPAAPAVPAVPAAPRRVYVNERLTAFNRRLFQRVREECRTRQWRYSWTRRGRIFARQEVGKPAHIFRSDADVDRVFGLGDVSSGSQNCN